MYSNTIKVVGQPCENGCGGNYVKNPKTGKIFCENKCWMNEALQAPRMQNNSNMAPRPNFTPKPAQKSDAPDWDKIRAEKEGEIRSNVALKMVSELIASGKIELQDWETWANTFYSYTPEKPLF